MKYPDRRKTVFNLLKEGKWKIPNKIKTGDFISE